MKFKVLGTAAATSIPLVFCNCTTCRNARTHKGHDYRLRSHAIIDDVVLIDLSPDLCSSTMQYNIDLNKVTVLLQTHSHSDHFDAGHFVTRWSEYATKNLNHLDIVASVGTLKGMNHWIKQNEPCIDLFGKEWQEDMKYSVIPIKSAETKRIGNYTITAIDSNHDANVEALIYLIEKDGKCILYGTDVLYLDDAAWKILSAKRIDVLLLDQTYGKGCNNGGHLDVEQIGEIVTKMRTINAIHSETRIYATHISHEGNGTHDEMRAVAKNYGYDIAYDGMEIEV